MPLHTGTRVRLIVMMFRTVDDSPGKRSRHTTAGYIWKRQCRLADEGRNQAAIPIPALSHTRTVKLTVTHLLARRTRGRNSGFRILWAVISTEMKFRARIAGAQCGLARGASQEFQATRTVATKCSRCAIHGTLGSSARPKRPLQDHHVDGTTVPGRAYSESPQSGGNRSFRSGSTVAQGWC